MIEPGPPSQTERCINYLAKGVRLVSREGEQKGDPHRFPSHPILLDGTAPKRSEEKYERASNNLGTVSTHLACSSALGAAGQAFSGPKHETTDFTEPSCLASARLLN